MDDGTLSYLFVIFLVAITIGWIPAVIAKSKGRSGFFWWIYGTLFFIIALPHVLIISRNDAGIERKKIKSGEMKKCPQCAELIRKEANVCRYCQCSLDGTASKTTPYVTSIAVFLVAGSFATVFPAYAQSSGSDPSVAANAAPLQAVTSAGYQISNVHTFWMSYRDTNRYMCLPTVSFNISSTSNMDDLSVNANFINESQKTVYSQGESWIHNIPSGLSTSVEIYGTYGFVDQSPGDCDISMPVPMLTVEVTTPNSSAPNSSILIIESQLNPIAYVSSVQNYLPLQH
jgi:hypothetical protein